MQSLLRHSSLLFDLAGTLLQSMTSLMACLCCSNSTDTKTAAVCPTCGSVYCCKACLTQDKVLHAYICSSVKSPVAAPIGNLTILNVPTLRNVNPIMPAEKKNQKQPPPSALDDEGTDDEEGEEDMMVIEPPKEKPLPAINVILPKPQAAAPAAPVNSYAKSFQTLEKVGTLEEKIMEFKLNEHIKTYSGLQMPDFSKSAELTADQQERLQDHLFTYFRRSPGEAIVFDRPLIDQVLIQIKEQYTSLYADRSRPKEDVHILLTNIQSLAKLLGSLLAGAKLTEDDIHSSICDLPEIKALAFNPSTIGRRMGEKFFQNIIDKMTFEGILAAIADDAERRNLDIMWTFLTNDLPSSGSPDTDDQMDITAAPNFIGLGADEYKKEEIKQNKYLKSIFQVALDKISSIFVPSIAEEIDEKVEKGPDYDEVEEEVKKPPRRRTSKGKAKEKSTPAPTTTAAAAEPAQDANTDTKIRTFHESFMDGIETAARKHFFDAILNDTEDKTNPKTKLDDDAEFDMEMRRFLKGAEEYAQEGGVTADLPFYTKVYQFLVGGYDTKESEDRKNFKSKMNFKRFQCKMVVGQLVGQLFFAAIPGLFTAMLPPVLGLMATKATTKQDIYNAKEKPLVEQFLKVQADYENTPSSEPLTSIQEAELEAKMRISADQNVEVYTRTLDAQERDQTPIIESARLPIYKNAELKAKTLAAIPNLLNIVDSRINAAQGENLDLKITLRMKEAAVNLRKKDEFKRLADVMQTFNDGINYIPPDLDKYPSEAEKAKYIADQRQNELTDDGKPFSTALLRFYSTDGTLGVTSTSDIWDKIRDVNSFDTMIKHAVSTTQKSSDSVSSKMAVNTIQDIHNFVNDPNIINFNLIDATTQSSVKTLLKNLDIKENYAEVVAKYPTLKNIFSRASESEVAAIAENIQKSGQCDVVRDYASTMGSTTERSNVYKQHQDKWRREAATAARKTASNLASFGTSILLTSLLKTAFSPLSILSYVGKILLVGSNQLKHNQAIRRQEQASFEYRASSDFGLKDIMVEMKTLSEAALVAKLDKVFTTAHYKDMSDLDKKIVRQNAINMRNKMLNNQMTSITDIFTSILDPVAYLLLYTELIVFIIPNLAYSTLRGIWTGVTTLFNNKADTIIDNVTNTTNINAADAVAGSIFDQATDVFQGLTMLAVDIGYNYYQMTTGIYFTVPTTIGYGILMQLGCTYTNTALNSTQIITSAAASFFAGKATLILLKAGYHLATSKMGWWNNEEFNFATFIYNDIGNSSSLTREMHKQNKEKYKRFMNSTKYKELNIFQQAAMYTACSEWVLNARFWGHSFLFGEHASMWGRLAFSPVVLMQAQDALIHFAANNNDANAMLDTVFMKTMTNMPLFSTDPKSDSIWKQFSAWWSPSSEVVNPLGFLAYSRAELANKIVANNRHFNSLTTAYEGALKADVLNTFIPEADVRNAVESLETWQLGGGNERLNEFFEYLSENNASLGISLRDYNKVSYYLNASITHTITQNTQS